jgi:hypothetical protein
LQQLSVQLEKAQPTRPVDIKTAFETVETELLLNLERQVGDERGLVGKAEMRANNKQNHLE